MGLHYDKVSLLLPFNGEVGTKLFTDRSPSNRAVSATFGDPIHSDSDYKFYGRSVFFDGTPGRINIGASSTYIGTNDFSVEFWFKVLELANLNGVFFFGDVESNSARVQSDILSDGRLGFYASSDVYGGWSLRTTNLVTINTWHHASFCRRGQNVFLSLDGQVVPGVTGDLSGVPWGDGHLGFARTSSLPRYLHGYMQDFRFTDGVSRYETTFTPPGRMIGSISGTVRGADGEPKINSTVMCFPRQYPKNVTVTQTDGLGGYEFESVVATPTTIVALAGDDEADFNSLIHDKVIPT